LIISFYSEEEKAVGDGDAVTKEEQDPTKSQVAAETKESDDKKQPAKPVWMKSKGGAQSAKAKSKYKAAQKQKSQLNSITKQQTATEGVVKTPTTKSEGGKGSSKQQQDSDVDSGAESDAELTEKEVASKDDDVNSSEDEGKKEDIEDYEEWEK
jgi:hypothetical protein